MTRRLEDDGSGSKGPRGPSPPPGPVKISNKRDGCLWWLHIFHVFRVPYPLLDALLYDPTRGAYFAENVSLVPTLTTVSTSSYLQRQKKNNKCNLSLLFVY